MIGDPKSDVGGGTLNVALALTSATDIFTFLITEKCWLVEFGLTVDADISSSVSAVVALDRIPLHDGVRVDDVASLTIPTLTVTGDTYYDNPTNSDGKLITLYPGDRLVVEVATAATSAGTGWPYIKTERIPEQNPNITGLHKSA